MVVAREDVVIWDISALYGVRRHSVCSYNPPLVGIVYGVLRTRST